MIISADVLCDEGSIDGRTIYKSEMDLKIIKEKPYMRGSGNDIL